MLADPHLYLSFKGPAALRGRAGIRARRLQSLTMGISRAEGHPSCRKRVRSGCPPAASLTAGPSLTGSGSCCSYNFRPGSWEQLPVLALRAQVGKRPHSQPSSGEEAQWRAPAAVDPIALCLSLLPLISLPLPHLSPSVLWESKPLGSPRE